MIMKRMIFLNISKFDYLKFDRFTSNYHCFLSRTKIVLILLFAFLMFSSCVRERVDTRKLILINESTSDIYWMKSENGKFKKQMYDPVIVEPNTSGSIGNIVPPWDVTIEYSKDKKLSIYIVIKDSVDKYGLDNIYKKRIFSKKYLIDMQYLEVNKWTIVYP